MKNSKSGLKIIFPLIALSLGLLSFKLYSQSKEIAALEQTILEKNQTFTDLSQAISELENEIANSDSLSFVEKIARDEYKMVKPKEIIFIDKDKDTYTSP
ncbi:MAG: septum formation initiator family protein [Bacillota bacterium]|nr:septum formation initiator family protein [Bacillota bacterium]